MTKSAVLRQVVVGCLPPILTLPVDVGCLPFLRFLGEGKLSREEGKVWEGEKCECERDMVQSHTERAHSLRSVRSPFSPSHTLPSSLESFPFPKNRKMLHSAPSMKHPPCECDCSPRAVPRATRVTSPTTRCSDETTPSP